MSDVDFNDISVKSINVSDKITFGVTNNEADTVARLLLVKGTQGPKTRLSFQFTGSAEMEIVPGKFNKKSAIMSQIQLFGQEREKGEGRKRAAITVFNDSDGGEALYITSDVTEGSPATLTPMPTVYRMGEIDVDVVIHGDKSIELKEYERTLDGTVVVTSVRKPVKDYIKQMTGNKSFDNL